MITGTDDEIYNYLMAWVANQGFAKRSRRFVANTNLNSRSWFLWRWDDDDDDDEAEEDGTTTSRMSLIGGKRRKALAYTPTFGSHYFVYKARLCVFRRDRGSDRSISLLVASEKEEISVSCFGRDPRVLKELLLEARAQFMKRDAAKTLIYRGTLRSSASAEPTWQRMMARVSRPFSTVILNERVKQDLIADVTDYLNPATRRWYANRGIPYRRGYLLHGPPGTGKSSLSLALAGFFKMRIYIVSLSSLSSTEENLATLFAELPRRCVVLLEDIDSAGLTHNRDEDGGGAQNGHGRGGGGGGGGPMAPKMGLRGKERAGDAGGFGLTLSGLLNILDGVASQEGRVLIMTTNHPEKLDKALTRPGRVDMTVEFGLADGGMIAAIFRAIFAPLEGDTATTPAPAVRTATTTTTTTAAAGAGTDDPDEVLKRLAAEKTRRDETVAKIEVLAEAFAARIPEREFSPAELQGYLMKNKRDPEGAVAGAEEWIAEARKEKAAKKIRDAEEKLRKEEEDKKKKEKAERKKAERKSRGRKSKKSKRGSKKSRKRDENDSSASESDTSSSGASSSSSSESEAEGRKKSSKSKAKSKAKKNDITIKVEEVPDEEAVKLEPASACTEKSDGFVDVKNEASKCTEQSEEQRIESRDGGDSGYSTPEALSK